MLEVSEERCGLGVGGATERVGTRASRARNRAAGVSTNPEGGSANPKDDRLESLERRMME